MKLFTEFYLQVLTQLSLRNPRDVMLPAVTCTVSEIFALEP